MSVNLIDEAASAQAGLSDPRPAASPTRSVSEHARNSWRSFGLWADRHAPALLIIFVAFAGRLIWAGHNPYWLDELYSVYIHATTPDTTAEVLESMWGIIHPPLYQLALFQWVNIFGHSEVATRTLSNIFVLLASLCVYFLAARVYGRRIGLAALVIFSLMYFPIYYAAETRSYGMVMMWAAASSLILYAFLRNLPVVKTWPRFLVDWRFLLLTTVNTAAIFTHYYLAFFVAAQGLFILAYFLCRHDGWKRPMSCLRLAVFGVLPPTILVLIWGGSMGVRFDRGGRFGTSGGVELGPFEAFTRYVLNPNVDIFTLVTGLVMLGAFVFFTRKLVRLTTPQASVKVWMGFYAAVALIGPFLLAYVVLAMAQQDAFSSRYFVFCAPGLALFMATGLFELPRLASMIFRRLKAGNPMRLAYRFSAILAILLAAATVLPQGGYAAANPNQSNLRLLAQMVLETVSQDEAHSYIIYDTGFRGAWPLINYYFEQNSEGVRAHRVINQAAERNRTFPNQNDRDAISRHDYLIVTFHHLHFHRYSGTISSVEEIYEEHYRVMLPGRQGGYIVYRTGIADTGSE